MASPMWVGMIASESARLVCEARDRRFRGQKQQGSRMLDCEAPTISIPVARQTRYYWFSPDDELSSRLQVWIAGQLMPVIIQGVGTA